MVQRLRSVLCILIALTALAGCYKPVRHLASDAALLKVGDSTRNDVLTYLGEPDEQVILEDGEERWIYREYERNMMKDAPVVGKYFGQPDYGTVVVTITDDVVSSCSYSAWEDDRRDWEDDFSWQEEKTGD